MNNEDMIQLTVGFFVGDKVGGADDAVELHTTLSSKLQPELREQSASSSSLVHNRAPLI